MESTYRLKWSDEALNGLKAIIDYLGRRFLKKDISKFAKKLDKQLEILKHNPEAFPISNQTKQVRRGIVAKLTSIYYCIEENEVKIVSVFDNGMNPDEVKV